MSLADKASLLLIPTGYKSQKVYSIFPTDGVGDFDFSRSSSATRIAKNGLITSVAANVPRLEYPLIDGVVSGCPSLLLEPQRTNLLPYSKDYSVSNWSKYGSGTGVAPILTSNYAISPDGTLNASRLQFNKGTGTTDSDISILNDNVTVSSGATTSKSVYVKSNTSEEYDIVVYGASDASGTNIKKVRVTSEWQRVDVYKTVSSTTSGITIGLREINVTGLSNTADVLVWGAQLEEGSYPTSYIPTNGAAVTRAAETATGSGDASTFNGSQGVLMAEISALADDGTVRSIAITDGTATNIITVRYFDSQIQGIYVNSANSITYQINYNVSNVKDSTKVALSYQSGSLKLYVNGILIQNIALAVNDIPDWNTLQFNIGNNTQIFYGKTKQIQYYDTALTDQELQKLTTI